MKKFKVGQKVWVVYHPSMHHRAFDKSKPYLATIKEKDKQKIIVSFNNHSGDWIFPPCGLSLIKAYHNKKSAQSQIYRWRDAAIKDFC